MGISLREESSLGSRKVQKKSLRALIFQYKLYLEKKRSEMPKCVTINGKREKTTTTTTTKDLIKTKDALKKGSACCTFPDVQGIQGHLWPRNARLNCWLFSYEASKIFCCLRCTVFFPLLSVIWKDLSHRHGMFFFFTLIEQMKHSVKSLSLFFSEWY